MLSLSVSFLIWVWEIPGAARLDMFEIGRPDLDWVELAKGMGVPGVRVTSLDGFAKALRKGFESEGPMLIEVPL